MNERGLAGVAVVEDPASPAVDLDRVVAVDDWRLNEQHQLEPFGSVEERASFGRLGNLLTVNGARAPERIVLAPGARVRLRIVNLCNARLMRIRFEGLKAFVIATDGQPTDSFEPLRSTLPFAPGPATTSCSSRRRRLGRLRSGRDRPGLAAGGDQGGGRTDERPSARAARDGAARRQSAPAPRHPAAKGAAGRSRHRGGAKLPGPDGKSRRPREIRTASGPSTASLA